MAALVSGTSANAVTHAIAAPRPIACSTNEGVTPDHVRGGRGPAGPAARDSTRFACRCRTMASNAPISRAWARVSVP